MSLRFSVLVRAFALLFALGFGASSIAAAPAPSPAPVAAVPALAALQGVQGLAPRVLRMALDALSCARARGVSGRDDLLTILDYSLPSTAPRLWVLDLARGRVLFHELVAHGAGSGDNVATRFSNAEGSRQTSLGLFLTAGTYAGGNGYSLKLRGLDPGVNDLAEERRIVIHGAWYVSPEQIRRYGRLGRSWGCPALPVASARPVIDAIKGGTFVFAYSADRTWLQASAQRACGTPAVPAPVGPVASAVSGGR
jgi:L,D-transpeptidase-like protein